MSHIVTIQARCTDPAALAEACRRLGLPDPEHGTARLYADEATGLLVRLPGRTYPAVVDTDEGQVHFDHYEGLWGDPAHLGRLLQAYALAKATSEARRKGHSVAEQALPDGSVRLTIRVGGGAP
jgi:hypothetical protein